MKKFKLIYILMFAFALLCAVLSLGGCSNESNISELSVENAKISFMRGDEFETGDDFKVYALLKNGTKEDVTAKATVRQERGMDMNVAGDYQITVAYGDKRVIYTVYVNESADVLRKIDADTTDVKKQYRLGDKVDLSGIALTLTYENEHGATYTAATKSLSGFNVTIANGGTTIKDVFTALGTYTVTIEQGNVKTSFDMAVDGVNTSTVESALAVGGYYVNTVVSGSSHVQGARLNYSEDSPLKPGDLFTSYMYEYTYGDNYTYFKDTHNAPFTEYHCSMDEQGFFVTYLEGGKIAVSNRNNADMMGGAPFILWYNSEMEYGLENALNNLYSHANSSNGDLEETVNADTRTYSFKYTGLEFRDSSYDYYETEVLFTLGEDYAIVAATIKQDYYENNSSLAGQPGYKPTFTTDASGKTTPGDEYSYRTVITVSQTTGKRTAKNHYGRDMFDITSYKLTYDGKQIDESVLECEAGKIYDLQITDVLPATANLTVDAIYFDYEGNLSGSDFWLSNEHFSIVCSNNTINLSVRHGGTWTLIFKTRNTTKKLTINVKGEAPDDMQPKLYNNASGSFYDGNEKTATTGGIVYFYGAVGAYDDPEQTVTVNSENAQYATITEATVNGVKCWKFTATKADTYQITVASAAQELVRCIFTFTVNEGADYSELLSGTYVAQDRVGDIYRVTFTRDNGDDVRGTVTVTRTPTDENNEPLSDRTVQQTLTFRVDDSGIVVNNDPANALWADFAINENNEFVLIDQRGMQIVLARE